MKYKDNLNVGDLVTVVNTHENRKTGECTFVVIDISEDNVCWWKKTPIIIVKVMLISGEYIDWNGYYGKSGNTYKPEDKIVYKFKKPGLKLVRKFEG